MIGKILLLATLVGLAGCEEPRPESYRVVAYDAVSHQWTFIRRYMLFGHLVKRRLTVVCTSYHKASSQGIVGQDACPLQVNVEYVSNIFPAAGREADYLSVLQSGEKTLLIDEGTGINNEKQFFDIVKDELIDSEN